MSDSGVNDQPVSSESEDRLPKTSPGARLAALREERGWSVEQVASQLNLAPRQILAIERDDYQALPGMAVTRGFIRAYAKLMKIDAAPLLVDLGGESVLVHDSLTPQKSLSTPFAHSRMPSMTERPGLSSKWVVGALLILLVAVGVWATRQGGEQANEPAPMSSAPAESTATTRRTDENTSPADVKTEPSGASSPEASPQVVPATEAPQAVMPAAPIAAPAPPAPAETTAAKANDALELKVREESWIEIRRSRDNSVLLSRTMKSGEAQSIPVTEPVSVVIGNAGGVEVTLRGNPLELKAGSKNNVARLTVK